MRLLAIDTASARCSVALLDGEHLTDRAVDTARDHAQMLLPLVDALLADAGFSLRDLDGIAFGRGPGSFTGVRIAAAVTQGLALGADRPVLPVSDLRALAEQARAAARTMESPEPGLLLACMDARMGELYWGVFRGGADPVGEAIGVERLSAPDALLAALADVGAPLAAAGMGLGAYPAMAADWHLPAERCLAVAEPHAADIARLAARDLAAGARWLDATAAQPVYLRDRVTHGTGVSAGL